MRACLIASAILFTAAPTFAQLPKNLPPAIPLWPKGAPGSEARVAEAEEVSGSNVSNVHNPTLTPYVPDKDKSTGTAVIICPGGGHNNLAIEHEGHNVGKWLADNGIAGFVLKYRLAREKGSPYKIEEHAYQDGQRALRMVRLKAKEWSVNPRQLGIMGFSAGAELASIAGSRAVGQWGQAVWT